MPSSKDRQRIEVPVHFYEQLAQIAETEDLASREKNAR